MSILFFHKNRLIKLFSSDSFLYKYVTVEALLRGKKNPLYLSKFIISVYQKLPTLLRLIAVSFRFFTLFYRSCHSLINFRFWVLTLSHFFVIYECIFFLRILTDYYLINQHQSNKFVKVILYISEPYLKFIQYFLPQGLLAIIIAFQIIEMLGQYLCHFSRLLICYDNSSKDLREVNLLLKAVFDETIVFS